MNESPQILLAHHLKSLRLPTFLAQHDKLARLCATEGVDHLGYLSRLAELELIDREGRMIERRIKLAKFPAIKSLDSFDFTAIPSLNKMQVLDLARCEYIERREKYHRPWTERHRQNPYCSGAWSRGLSARPECWFYHGECPRA